MTIKRGWIGAYRLHAPLLRASDTCQQLNIGFDQQPGGSRKDSECAREPTPPTNQKNVKIAIPLKKVGLQSKSQCLWRTKTNAINDPAAELQDVLLVTILSFVLMTTRDSS